MTVFAEAGTTTSPPAVSIEDDGELRRERLFWPAVALVLLPLLASAVRVLAEGRIFPAGDFAGIELRTRDVGHHPVLLGLWSRVDWNHPGPALFYLLALPYRLTGSNPSGLQLGALLINGGAIVGMAVLARRRGGLALSLLTLVGCGILLRALGPAFAFDPWNPSVPVLPFGFLVLLCWSMFCDAVWALPVAAAVASFCVQTHIGYLPMAVPLWALGAASLVWRTKRAPPEKHPGGLRQRRDLSRAFLLTGAILAVMWLPPLVEQAIHRPGNMLRIARYFKHPDGNVSTLGDGYRIVGAQFGLRAPWVSGNDKVVGWASETALLHNSSPPLLLVPLVLVGIVLWRRRSLDAAKLVMTVLAALAFGVLAIDRTIGTIFAYRLKWAWVLGMLGLVTTVWGAWILLASRYRRAEQRYLTAFAMAALLGLAVVNVFTAIDTDTPWKAESKVFDKLVPATLAALPHRSGAVIVRSADRGDFMYQGLQLALERRGLPAQTENAIGIVGNGADHRVYRRGPVRAIVTIATSNDMARMLSSPRERLIAYSGPVSLRERVSIASKGRALQRAFKAGTLSERALFFGLLKLSKRSSGSETAIFMHRLSPRDARAQQP